ncbi:MAG: penicillin acylase family protein [Gammaproteobacteria bacterium]|nr:penicillin acylase family protein [Gammaproteobacteria bacterium]MDH4253267.1 penicillin acylase family protein [Gammaproteobacteria bacterium]MDH5308673.1 penicillin acylase family protein [Gammaproteobacteria bacterium]
MLAKYLTRGLAGLLIIVALATIGTFFLLRASLPGLDGRVMVAGITAPISIERDAAGIPTIRAGSREDLAFGTGFVHGQDRYFQMDLTRRQAAGELSALFGAVALELDKRNRLHRFRSRASDVIATMTGAEQALMNAYVAGVNAGLANLAARPFEYFVLRAEPDPWTIEDTLLVVYAMFMELNDERAARDVSRGFARDVLPGDVFAWMYPEGTEWDAPLLGSPRAVPPVPAADRYDLRGTRVVGARSSRGDAEAPLPGSNNWAVAGRLTGDGRAIVANDMHLNITAPNIFYRARLVGTGPAARDVTGVTLPGTPVVVAGSNGRVAWGFTNSYGDWSDAVLLHAGDEPDTYLDQGGPRAITTHLERIDVKGGEPVEFWVRETQWGPILDDVEFGGGELVVSWIAHHAAAVNVRQLELETVTSVSDAMAIANGMGIPPQNFVVGDADGNIGWTIAGRIPVRGPAAREVPADWSTGGGWSGWLEPEQYPRVLNPASGRIWTANARVADGEALALIGDGGYDLGARQRQIRDGLAERERFVPSDMLEIQFDNRALFLIRWRELLLEILDDGAVAGNQARAEMRKLVADWVPRAEAGSVGYRLVRSFRAEAREMVFDMLMTPVRAMHGPDVRLRISNQFEAPLWQLVTDRPPHLLSDDFASWEQLLLAAADRTLQDLEQNYGDDLAARTWGERNMADIRHPLSRALPALSGWLDMPREPLDGDWNMPKVQGPSFGPSERFAVSPGAEQDGYLHMPAGQSGHPLSPYYRAGHADWVRGTPSEFLPGEARHALRLVPEG